MFCTLLATSTVFAQSGTELFTNYCSSCHATVVGTNESGGEVTNIYEAPYIKDVVSKLKTETKTKEEFLAFVKDYIENPDKRKSLYGKRAIKDFGLMPSLKGVMSDDDSTKLANYLYSDYDNATPKIKEKKSVSDESSQKSEQFIKSEALFTRYCSSCHTTAVGVNESGGEYTHIYEAPYIKYIINKLKSETKTKKEFISFVKDYIENPDKRKSLYSKKAIKDFGLMPSLKGVMNDSESTGLADYLYHKYD